MKTCKNNQIYNSFLQRTHKNRLSRTFFTTMKESMKLHLSLSVSLWIEKRLRTNIIPQKQRGETKRRKRSNRGSVLYTWFGTRYCGKGKYSSLPPQGKGITRGGIYPLLRRSFCRAWHSGQQWIARLNITEIRHPRGGSLSRRDT